MPRPRTVITLQKKKEIIQKIQDGESQSEIVRTMNIPKQTVSDIWINRDKILEAEKTSSAGIKRVESKSQRHPVMNKMEQLLMLFITDLGMKGLFVLHFFLIHAYFFRQFQFH